MTARCEHCGSAMMTWNRTAILNAVKAWAETHGKPPTSKQWKKASPSTPSQSTARKLFGTWNAMMTEAGFERRPNNIDRSLAAQQRDRENIITAIFEFRYEHGRLPRYRDFRRADGLRPTAATIERIFGSWNAALVAAGYEPSRKLRSIEGYQRQAGAASREAA